MVSYAGFNFDPKKESAIKKVGPAHFVRLRSPLPLNLAWYIMKNDNPAHPRPEAWPIMRRRNKRDRELLQIRNMMITGQITAQEIHRRQRRMERGGHGRTSIVELFEGLVVFQHALAAHEGRIMTFPELFDLRDRSEDLFPCDGRCNSHISREPSPGADALSVPQNRSRSSSMLTIAPESILGRRSFWRTLLRHLNDFVFPEDDTSHHYHAPLSTEDEDDEPISPCTLNPPPRKSSWPTNEPDNMTQRPREGDTTTFFRRASTAVLSILGLRQRADSLAPTMTATTPVPINHHSQRASHQHSPYRCWSGHNFDFSDSNGTVADVSPTFLERCDDEGKMLGFMLWPQDVEGVPF